jgi:hypothetical protein
MVSPESGRSVWVRVSDTRCGSMYVVGRDSVWAHRSAQPRIPLCLSVWEDPRTDGSLGSWWVSVGDGLEFFLGDLREVLECLADWLAAHASEAAAQVECVPPLRRC